MAESGLRPTAGSAKRSPGIVPPGTGLADPLEYDMRELVRLSSTAGTGHFYVTTKNPKKKTDKLTLKKYDPVVRKHVEYKEAKLR